MTTSIRYANTALGTPILLPTDMGTLSPGDQSSVLDVYISHDGTAKITNCKLYILPYSAGVYLGANTAQDDYETVIGWGDSSYPATSGGGLYVNMNHSGGFPDGDWQVFRTGVGDSLGTALSLPASAISTGLAYAGEIQVSGEAHIRFRLDVPASYTSTGLTYVDTLLSYSTTS